jgi:hypothetical protein
MWYMARARLPKHFCPAWSRSLLALFILSLLSTSQTQSTIKQASGQRASVAYPSDWSATSFHLL